MKTRQKESLGNIPRDIYYKYLSNSMECHEEREDSFPMYPGFYTSGKVSSRITNVFICDLLDLWIRSEKKDGWFPCSVKELSSGQEGLKWTRKQQQRMLRSLINNKIVETKKVEDTDSRISHRWIKINLVLVDRIIEEEFAKYKIRMAKYEAEEAEKEYNRSIEENIDIDYNDIEEMENEDE